MRYLKFGGYWKMMSNPELTEIDRLAVLSIEPLMDPWLEGLTVDPRYRFLFHLTRKFQPQACLELGAGIVAAHMAAAAHSYGGFVVGIDGQDRRENTAFIGDKFGNYRRLWADTLTAVPRVIETLAGRDVGLVFQNSHHYMPARLEWEYYQSLLDTSFVWVCSDTSSRAADETKGMADYFEELPGQKRTFGFLHLIGVVMP